jgi:tRNA pseudouridine38-40 synthase
VTRWLVQFGYDGTRFQGYARQPNARTVEGEIRDGVRRLRLLSSSAEPWLDVASRTDRGVSARANALAIRSDLPGPALLRALNGIAPEIFFRRASIVPEEFRVRAALGRWYRYFETRKICSVERWHDAARLFHGRIDVRSLGRGLPSHSAVWREVSSVKVRRIPEGLRVDLRAPSFVWGMVRKIIAALRAADSGVLPLAVLSEALHGRRRLTLPLAEPESLVLWEVRYPVRWRWVRPKWSSRQARYLGDEQSRRRARGPVLRAVGSRR